MDGRSREVEESKVEGEGIRTQDHGRYRGREYGGSETQFLDSMSTVRGLPTDWVSSEARKTKRRDSECNEWTSYSWYCYSPDLPRVSIRRTLSGTASWPSSSSSEKETVYGPTVHITKLNLILIDKCFTKEIFTGK